jgi:uncharacterized protein with von Willebrand factor type A (vWA) domain
MTGDIPLSRALYARLGVLGLLLLALFNPTISRNTAIEEFFILLDDSASMGNGLDTTWPVLAQQLAEAPGAELHVIRFAAAAVDDYSASIDGQKGREKLLSSPSYPRRLPLDRSATDLETALRAALRRVRPDRSSALLVVSDMRETRGQAEHALKIAAASSVPVYGFIPSGEADPGDGAILDLQYPTYVHAGQKIPVIVRVSGSPSTTGRLALRVNGQDRESIEIDFGRRGENVAQIPIDPCPPGICRLEFSLESGTDRNSRNNARIALVNAVDPRPILYVSSANRPPPAALGLQRIGRAVRIIPPVEFPRRELDMQSWGAVVLDDVAIGDMAPDAWSALIDGVRRSGLGLLVLGGANSFGAGAYRHSALEKILPVTAEGRDTQQAASVLFLLDKSGSMDQDRGGVSRLGMARRAVLETVRGLWERDRVGLTVFDAGVHEVLPLGVYEEPAKMLERTLAFTPSGGTRLLPALESGVERLSHDGTERRILVLVSDGRFLESDFGGIEKKLADADIEVIALAVGNQAAMPALERLARMGRGKVMHVRQLAQLPRLMRREVEKHRDAAELGKVAPQSRKTLPFFTDVVSWPVLSGYMVTSPQPEATVFLESPNGDPLLAVRQAGGGKVAVFPGGLNAWAPAWLAWSDWGRFFGGLIDWISAATLSPLLHAQIHDRPGRLELELEALASDKSEWAEYPAVESVVTTPSGGTYRIPLNRIAPGRYRGDLPVSLPGIYRAVFKAGDRSLQTAALHESEEEAGSSGNGESLGDRWFREGLIRPWPSDGEIAVDSPVAVSLRPLLAGLAGASYLLLLVCERVGGFRGFLCKKTTKND